MDCKVWLSDSEDDPESVRLRSELVEGTYVRVFGKVQEYNGVRSLSAFSMAPITDFNEIANHFSQTMLTHLIATRGDVSKQVSVNQTQTHTLYTHTPYIDAVSVYRWALVAWAAMWVQQAVPPTIKATVVSVMSDLEISAMMECRLTSRRFNVRYSIVSAHWNLVEVKESLANRFARLCRSLVATTSCKNATNTNVSTALCLHECHCQCEYLLQCCY